MRAALLFLVISTSSAFAQTMVQTPPILTFDDRLRLITAWGPVIGRTRACGFEETQLDPYTTAVVRQLAQDPLSGRLTSLFVLAQIDAFQRQRPLQGTDCVESIKALESLPTRPLPDPS